MTMWISIARIVIFTSFVDADTVLVNEVQANSRRSEPEDFWSNGGKRLANENSIYDEELPALPRYIIYKRGEAIAHAKVPIVTRKMATWSTKPTPAPVLRPTVVTLPYMAIAERRQKSLTRTHAPVVITTRPVRVVATRTSRPARVLATRTSRPVRVIATRTSRPPRVIATRTSRPVRVKATRTSRTPRVIATRTSRPVRVKATRTSRPPTTVRTTRWLVTKRTPVVSTLSWLRARNSVVREPSVKSSMQRVQTSSSTMMRTSTTVHRLPIQQFTTHRLRTLHTTRRQSTSKFYPITQRPIGQLNLHRFRSTTMVTTRRPSITRFQQSTRLQSRHLSSTKHTSRRPLATHAQPDINQLMQSSNLCKFIVEKYTPRPTTSDSSRAVMHPPNFSARQRNCSLHAVKGRIKINYIDPSRSAAGKSPTISLSFKTAHSENSIPIRTYQEGTSKCKVLNIDTDARPSDENNSNCSKLILRGVSSYACTCTYRITEMDNNDCPLRFTYTCLPN